MSEFSDDLRSAVSALRSGGIILYPTDTVWGIGCDATNSAAIRKVFEIKRRSDAKALITLVGSLGQLERTVDCIPEVAFDLIEFSERPLTIVYDHPAAVASIASELCAPDGTIGVRVTFEKFSSELCKAFGKPIVSTSANISGSPTPMSFAEIDSEILKAADYVCKTGREIKEPAQPSTVMRLTESGEFKIIRP